MVWNMTYCYKNNLIASCSFDNTLKIYDYGSQKCFLTFSFDENIVDMTFSDDGNYLGIVLLSGIAKVYETINFQIICTYDQQKSNELPNSISRVILFQNDKYILTSSSVDGSIHKWK
jgi:WD40 repeat protein